MNILIDKSDLRRVEKLLGAFKPDWRAVMVRTGAAGLSWINRNFQTEGAMAYRGKKWVPLRPATIALRRNKGGPIKILQDTGELKQSATFELTQFPTIGGRLGFTSVKARRHQMGDPKEHLPARRILPDKKQAANILVRTLVWSIRRDLKRAGYSGRAFGPLPPA